MPAALMSQPLLQLHPLPPRPATAALRKYRSFVGHAAKAQIEFRGIRQFDIC
jgi:hypothetical protein